jgi:hypothetical protein
MLDAFKTCGSSPPKNYTVRAVLPIGLTPNAAMGSVAKWAGPIFPSP